MAYYLPPSTRKGAVFNSSNYIFTETALTENQAEVLFASRTLGSQLEVKTSAINFENGETKISGDVVLGETQTGQNIISVQGDKVGINNDTPNYPLDVNGDINCDDVYINNLSVDTRINTLANTIENFTNTTATIIEGDLYVGPEAGEGKIYIGGGNSGDHFYDHSLIETRTYEAGTEKTEMLLFKGNDTTLNNDGNDRIRLRAAEICLDTYDETIPASDVKIFYDNDDIKVSLTSDLNIYCDTNISQNLDVGESTTLNNLTATGATMLNTLAATGTTTLTTLNATNGTISHLTSTGLATNDLTAHTSAHLSNLNTSGTSYLNNGVKIDGAFSYDVDVIQGFNTTQEINVGLLVDDAPIVINGFQALNWSGALLNVAGVSTGIVKLDGTSGRNTSIYCIGRVISSGYIAVSSNKIKDVEASLDDNDTMNEAIELFKSIPQSKYSFKDEQMNDEFTHFGLIAEDMPNKIYTVDNTGFPPNIYQAGIYEDRKITLLNPINFDEIENKNEIRILYHKDNITKHVETQKFEFVDDYTILLENNIDVEDNDVFVYGTRENVPAIEKESYFELTSCVVKNLLERIEKLEEKINQLGV